MGDRAHGIVMNQRCSTRAGEKLGWQPAGPSIGDDSVAAMPGPDVSPAVHPEAFSAGEAAFLDQEALGRLAYLDASGAPVVVPVAFRRTRDEQGASVIAIAGHELRASAKYRSLARDPRCAIVVDSSIGPSARGVLVKGTAALVDGPGRPLIVITPTRV
jgi:pyridoxamine 5'-phosphate oxidase family protein